MALLCGLGLLLTLPSCVLTVSFANDEPLIDAPTRWTMPSQLYQELTKSLFG